MDTKRNKKRTATRKSSRSCPHVETYGLACVFDKDFKTVPQSTNKTNALVRHKWKQTLFDHLIMTNKTITKMPYGGLVIVVARACKFCPIFLTLLSVLKERYEDEIKFAVLELDGLERNKSIGKIIMQIDYVPRFLYVDTMGQITHLENPKLYSKHSSVIKKNLQLFLDGIINAD